MFFTRSPASRQAGQESLQRMYARTEDRDTATTWQTREAQYDAVCTRGIPDSAHGFLFQHHAEFARDVDEFLTGPA